MTRGRDKNQPVPSNPDASLELPDDLLEISRGIPSVPRGFGELRQMIGLLPDQVGPNFPNHAASSEDAGTGSPANPGIVGTPFGYGVPGSQAGGLFSLGSIDGSQIVDGTIPSTAFASGIGAVLLVAGPANPTLPSATYPVGQIIYNESTALLYKNVADAWQPVVQAVDLSGQITNAQISDGTIAGTKFASGLQPVYVGSADPTLPDAAYPVGSTFYNTTSGLLKKNVANAWTNIVNTTDLSGTIGTTQITAGAVTTPKLAAGAVTANEIAANTITTGKMAAGAITTTELAANAVTAAKIAATTITAAQIAANAITTAKLAAGAVTANELAANSVIAGKVAAGAITATEIAAATITTAKLVVGGIDISTIGLSGSINNGLLAANSVQAAQIQANSIDTTKLTAGTLSATNITAGTLAGVTISGCNIIAGSNGFDGFIVKDASGTTVGTWTSTGGVAVINGATISTSGAISGGSVTTGVVSGIGSVSGPNAGMMMIDSSSGADGRFYVYHSSAWHYVALTHGFEVPAFEVNCPVCGYLLEPGQDLVGIGDRVLPDGALHGLWRHRRCPHQSVIGRLAKRMRKALR